MFSRITSILILFVLASCCCSSDYNRYNAALSKVPAKASGGRIQRADIFRAIDIPAPPPMPNHLNGTPREIIRLDDCVTMELWHFSRHSGTPKIQATAPTTDLALSGPGSPKPSYYYQQVESIRLYKNSGKPIWRRDTRPFRASE